MIDISSPGEMFHAIEQPGSADEVSAILRRASESGRCVVPFGGTQSLRTGNPVDFSGFTGLDLAGLDGVVSYEPADLTLSLNAGTRVATIQRILGEQGQELPIDCPHPERTTIGGLVATGYAGPRRLRSGSLRDLLIGCEFVQGDGMIANAGGLVVKNVSGFEIPRMLHGSWGALAVITRVNLKVTPRPRADATVEIPSSLLTALELSETWLASSSLIDACVVAGTMNEAVTMARVLGRSAAVSDICSALPRSEDARIVRDESPAEWQRLVDRFSESSGRAVIAFGCPPNRIRSLVQTLLDSTGSSVELDWLISPGIGSIRLTLPVDDTGHALFASLIRAGAGPGVVLTVESAPDAWKSGVGVWGVEPSGIEVMRDIKRAFDPAGILNPGRLFI